MYSEGRVTLEEQENSDHKEEKAMLDTLSWSPRAAGGAADLPVLQVTTGAVCAQSVLTTAACLIHPRVVFCPRRSQAAALWFWEMGRSQMLRQLVTERLCSAAEEICSLLEQTAEEHQAEGVQYRTQIIQEVQEVQELSVSKPRVVILPPDPQLVVQKVLPLQKTEQTELQNETPVLLPIEEEPKTQKTQQTQTASDFKVPPEVPGCRSPGFWEMGRSQMLRKLVTERLCSAAEEICGLLEQTVEEHQAEGVQYRRQIIQLRQQVQELSVSNPRVVILPPDDVKVPLRRSKSQETVRRRRTQHGRNSCRLCGEKFTSSSDLCCHMRLLHKGQKAFKCSHCNSQFSRLDYLTLHSKSHKRGKELHKCSFCEKCFSQNTNLTVHLKTHKQRKPFFCRVCDKKIAFQLHFKSYGHSSKDKMFCCLLCDEKFDTRQDLRRHKDVHENGESSADV
ncbi:zinc finger protein 287-like isoform X1 [Acanthochromis polyacanthus]|uniref:zinc finger protein 287-like isoform X1 n=1 Tax=Acanthochromis polyacanthus TaxID=80966 RepID=UPI0022346B50|nr:zinc finger protein 287-like isoform X1 [Acanthochromis polyacanthus]